MFKVHMDHPGIFFGGGLPTYAKSIKPQKRQTFRDHIFGTKNTRNAKHLCKTIKKAYVLHYSINS